MTVGILDTNTLILVERIDPDALPAEPVITAVTLAELSVGPLVAVDADQRAARQARLQEAESVFEPLPFDAAAARAFGRVASSLRRSGRKPTARAFDTFFLAQKGADVVGMANVKRYDRMPVAGVASAGSWGYVGNVFVLPEQRNAGVGRALMDEILAWAAQNGLAHLRLAPSPRSRPFYERLGYAPGSVVELDPPDGG